MSWYDDMSAALRNAHDGLELLFEEPIPESVAAHWLKCASPMPPIFPGDTLIKHGGVEL